MKMTGPPHRFAFCALLVLAACTPGGGEPPETVLARAAAQVQQLQSAVFDASFSYAGGVPVFRAEGRIDGVLAEAGRQLSFALEGSMTVPSEGPERTVSVDADVVVAGEGEAYVRLRRADGSVLLLPGVGLVPEEALDRWFSVGGGTASGAQALTPDPSLIALQTEAVVVTKDRGYDTVDGERSHAYDIAIDRAKMLAFLERVSVERSQPFDRTSAEALLDAYEAAGTIWIDASTSVLRRVSWTFESTGDAPASRATLSLHLSKHNEPVTIAPPADAVPLKEGLPNAILPSF